MAATMTMQLAEPAPALLSVTDQASDLRLEAAILIEQIDAYWEERGVLPEPFALTPYLEEGYQYEIVNRNHGLFIVRRASAGVTVTYDGSLPLALWIVLGGKSAGGAQ